MLNLTELLEKSSQNYPEHIAITFGTYNLPYHRLVDAIARLAQGLTGLGFTKGDKIALMLPNLPQFPICYYAILKIGASVIPINITYNAFELNYVLKDSQPKAIIVWENFFPLLSRAMRELTFSLPIIYLGKNSSSQGQNLTELIINNPPLSYPVETEADDTAVILYTSGTTEPPKGVELTHQNLYSNALACQEILSYNSHDNLMAVFPLFHPFSQTIIMNAGLAAGATLTIHHRFNPLEVLESIGKNRITSMFGVPAMYQAFLNVDLQKFDLTSIRHCITGATDIPYDVSGMFEKRIERPVLEVYGLSEASPIVTMNRPDRERKSGSAGIPISNVDLKIFDEQHKELPPGAVGEIAVKGPNVMKKYLNRPQATAEALTDGWLHTGDMGYIDDDGYLFVVDRKKELILKGGFHVYPKEVERLLLEHPKVKEVAVIGVPNSLQGEEVKACVVLKPGQTATPQELVDYCREKIAVYKCPKYIQFFETLPKNSTGKILKRKLREEVSKEF